MPPPNVVKSLLVLGSTLCVTLAQIPAFAWSPNQDWKDSQCRKVRDGAGKIAEVCQGIYDGNKVYLGIYWTDGAEVVGPCSTADPEPIEYKGMSQADANSWVSEYCP